MRRKSKSKLRYYSLSRKDPHAETKKKYGERVKPPATRHTWHFNISNTSVSSLTNIVGTLRMCAYSYHAWWCTDKIRNNFSTKTESKKINRINGGTLIFSFFWNIPLSHLPCVRQWKEFELLLSCKHFSSKSNEHLQTIVFHHANKNVTTIVPLFLTLKTMVHTQSTVFILHCPVCSFTHVCMLLTRLVT